jgi:predicted transposase YbfD/YdcC
VLKGAWTDEHGQFTLFSAMAHREAVTVGQVQVPAGTNEITQVKALLEVVPVLEEVVVTTDAAHTQSDTAEYVKGTRGFDYVMTVKGNQPQLLSAAVFEKCLPLLQHDPDHVVEERGRGLIKRWETWITDAAGIDWPHIEQVAFIRRNTYTVAGAWIRKEYAWLVTSGESSKVTAETVHEYVRGHWGIENKSHYRGMSPGVKMPSKYTLEAAPKFWPPYEISHWDFFGSTVSTRSKKLPNGSPVTGTGHFPCSLPSVTTITLSDLGVALTR